MSPTHVFPLSSAENWGYTHLWILGLTQGKPSIHVKSGLFPVTQKRLEPVYHLFQYSHELTSLDFFLIRSSVIPKFYIVHQKSPTKLFSKLSMQRHKRLFGRFIIHSPLPPSFSDDGLWGMITTKKVCPGLGMRQSNFPVFNSWVCPAPMLCCAFPFVKGDAISWPSAFPIWEPKSLGTEHGWWYLLQTLGRESCLSSCHLWLWLLSGCPGWHLYYTLNWQMISASTVLWPHKTPEEA